MSWILESNRTKHLMYAIPVGFVFTILAVLGCAFGMEFKDKEYGGKFDWLDIAATMIGGTIGQTAQALLVYSIVSDNPVISFWLVVIAIIAIFINVVWYMISD